MQSGDDTQDPGARFEAQRPRITRIVHRHAGPILRFEGVDDVVQGVFARALGSFADATFENDAAFNGWLATVAERHVADRIDHWSTLKRSSGHLLRATSTDRAGARRFLKSNRKALNSGHPQHNMPKKGSGVDFVPAPAPWATPLCYALRGGDEATVEYLIERGATITGNEEALFVAADDNPAMVRRLLENGADQEFAPRAHPDDTDLFAVVSTFGIKRPTRKHESEELVYLCRGDRGGSPDQVQRLLANGADIDHRDHKGKTALHRAAKAAFVTTLQVLLDHGATIDVGDLKNETALFDAVRSTIKNVDNKKRAIRLLLSRGASQRHANSSGKTAYDVAVDCQRRPESAAIAKLLRH